MPDVSMEASVPEALRSVDAVRRVLHGYAQKYADLLREQPEFAPREGADGVQCPCCGGRFAHFERFRHKPEHPWRENAKCPVCGSLERHRRLWLQLCHENDLFTQGGRLLHFAPEPFLRAVFAACAHLDYVDCDLQAERARNNVDITRLPFADSSFAWLICSHVLEHVDDDRAALKELRRVLAPGGVAWIMVPTLKGATLVHQPPAGGFTPNDHRREYGMEEFISLTRQAGFTAEVLHVKALDSGLRARYRLSNHIYRCRRPMT